jgi:DNA-binding LytR/AlgR family response regulator
MGNESSLSGIVALNKMEMIDAVDYFRTEDNINFLVTEDGNYLEI